MAWNNIYDLYNNVLDDDKSLVDTIIAAIKTEIENRTNNNLDFLFTYELTTVLTTQSDVQIDRIRDQVEFILKSIGIRCVPQGTSLIIQWFIRNNREFLHSYY